MSYEFDPGPVGHQLLIDVADAAVRHPPLDDDGTVAEREMKVMQRVELQRKTRFHLRAAPADEKL